MLKYSGALLLPYLLTTFEPTHPCRPAVQAGILGLSNELVRALRLAFPHSVDELTPDAGHKKGTRLRFAFRFSVRKKRAVV